MVKSQIIKTNGEPVEVDYLMRRNGELADLRHLSRRHDQRSGDPPLGIRRHPQNAGNRRADRGLNRKADILTGTTARSF